MSYNVDAFTFKDRHELYKLQQEYINETKRGEYNKLTSKNDTITLYHGTSSHLIPEILANGLRPRKATGANQWEHVGSSIHDLVYLTNKWHYFFALNTATDYYDEVFGEHWGIPDIDLPAYPCYIEVDVPLASLTLDEDIFMSAYMQDLYEKHDGNPAPYATVEGALENYGTLAHIGAIPPSAIKSFTILGNKQVMLYCIEGEYHDDYIHWQKGLGLGKLSLQHIKKWEMSLAGNKTYDVALLPKNKRIIDVQVDKHSLKVSLKTEKIKA